MSRSNYRRRLCPKRSEFRTFYLYVIWYVADVRQLKTVVQAPDILMVRNARYFARPHEFVPERWLPKDHEFYDDQFSGDCKEASKPFSIGPRQCIGMSLAYAEWRLVLTKLVRRFDWELVGERQDLINVARLKLLWEMPPILVSFKPLHGLALGPCGI